MVIQGYLISENTDLLEIESQIQKVQKKILNIHFNSKQELFYTVLQKAWNRKG